MECCAIRASQRSAQEEKKIAAVSVLQVREKGANEENIPDLSRQIALYLCVPASIAKGTDCAYGSPRQCPGWKLCQRILMKEPCFLT